MPKGVYERKTGLKRTISEERKQQLRENLAKAREKRNMTPDSPEAIEAKKRNAQNANSKRVARDVLKKMPMGAKEGEKFKLSRYRTLTVIDPAPVKVAPDRWEQRFSQAGKVTSYGQTIVFDGIVKVVWEYEPNIENLLVSPALIKEGENSDAEHCTSEI